MIKGLVELCIHSSGKVNPQMPQANVGPSL